MSRTGSFKQASDLLRARIREAGEARGFAATRLLTHWAEIVGEDMARLARPKDIRFGRGTPKDQGATLVLEVVGPAALRLEMEKERIRERVNAVYGYAAIKAIRLRQVGPQGFTMPTAAFAAPTEGPTEGPPEGPPETPPAAHPAVAALAEVGDTELRLALAALAANVLSKSRS